MWDLQKALPFGRLSIRSTLMFAAAMIVATFAYILASAPTTHAAPATWNGNVITHEGRQYSPVADAAAGDGKNLPPGSKVYASIETTGAGAVDPTQKAYLMYFAPGTDPPAATSAQLVSYDYTPGTNTYANKSAATTVELTPRPAGAQETTSCDSTFTSGI